jgi:hypothetical protein
VQDFVAHVNSYPAGFKRIGTGEALTYYRQAQTLPAGSSLGTTYSAYQASMASQGFTLSNLYSYWDYYDVGTPFSTNLVGYDLSTHYASVYNYMKNNYQVTAALREVKKY